MKEIHCHNCGGFIGDERPVFYEVALESPGVAAPRSDLCTCAQPVLYRVPMHNSLADLRGAL